MKEKDLSREDKMLESGVGFASEKLICGVFNKLLNVAEVIITVFSCKDDFSCKRCLH